MNKLKNIKSKKTGTIIWFLFLFCLSFQISSQENSDYVEEYDKTKNVDSVASLKNEMNKLDNKEEALKESENPQNLKDLKVISPLDLLKDKNAEKNLKNALGPLRDIPDAKIKELVLAQKDKNEVIGFLSNHPKILNFIIRFVKDDKAPYYLVRISKNKKLVYIYLAFLVISIVINMKLKRMIIKKVESKFKTFVLEVIRFNFFTILRFIVFVAIFYKFLKPTIDIIYKF